jgi:hypothetical protein
MIHPYDAWTLAKLMSGGPVNGELNRGVTEFLCGFAS